MNFTLDAAEVGGGSEDRGRRPLGRKRLLRAYLKVIFVAFRGLPHIYRGMFCDRRGCDLKRLPRLDGTFRYQASPSSSRRVSAENENQDQASNLIEEETVQHNVRENTGVAILFVRLWAIHAIGYTRRATTVNFHRNWKNSNLDRGNSVAIR